MNLYDARRLAERADAELPRVRVGTQRDLIVAVTTLADDVERLQQSLAAAGQYQEMYRELSLDWNAVWNACKAAGIEVYSPCAIAPLWHWHCPDGKGGIAEGIEETAGAALAAALGQRLALKR